MKIAIIGGGISGLSLAYLLQDYFEVFLFEKENRLGGKAKTQKINNYLFEEGVNGFLNNSKYTLDLCNEIGITPIPANSASKNRYIYDHKLYKLDFKNLLFSDLLSFKGKIRVLKEFFIDKNCEEETLEEFAVRRFGEEFNKKIMVPFSAGVFASTPNKLSVNAAFSRIKEVECKYGSLFKGMLKLKRGGNVRGELYSFEYGMSQFIEQLSKKSKKVKFINREINSLNELEGFDKIILSTPAYVSSNLVDGKLRELLNSIYYNSVAVVGLDFDIINLNAFGVLTIHNKSLGILLDKFIFDNRNGIRIMVGGDRFNISNMSDDEIINLALNDIKEILNLENPKIEWIKVHQKAIPVYQKGHQDLVEAIFKEAKKRGIYLHSNAYRGVSFNDCIKNSYLLAKELIGVR